MSVLACTKDDTCKQRSYKFLLAARREKTRYELSVSCALMLLLTTNGLHPSVFLDSVREFPTYSQMLWVPR
jgi:hypothetical protein